MIRETIVCVLVAAPVLADAPAPPVVVGKHAPVLDHLRDEDGKPFAFPGGWVVVMLGFQQCPDCTDGLAVINRLAGKLGDRATFASIDATGEHSDHDPEHGEKLHAKLRPLHVRLLADSDDRGVGDYAAILRYVSPGVAPVTVAIDPDGIVRYVKHGFDRKHAHDEAVAIEHALTELLPVK
ncbi:MAG TPA: hypothetical protein VMJ10_32065 [Kofleriaceae bacterium]|nr:hypothetical protein [Kofleriaceae bacterium]